MFFSQHCKVVILAAGIFLLRAELSLSKPDHHHEITRGDSSTTQKTVSKSSYQTRPSTSESTGSSSTTERTVSKSPYQTRPSTSESTGSSSTTKRTVSKSSYQTPSTSDFAISRSVTKEPVSKSLQQTFSRSSPGPRPVKNHSISASPTAPVITAKSSRSTFDQGETKEDFVLKMNRTFTKDLLDENSEARKDLAKVVEKELTKVFKDVNGFERVEVNHFRQGSVLASSSAYFSSGSTSGRSIRSTLEEAKQSGALSSLGVTEITYSQEKRDTAEPEGTSTFTYVLIAVGVVAGIALCVFVVSKVIRTKAGVRSKKAKKNQRELGEIKEDKDTTTTNPV